MYHVRHTVRYFGVDGKFVGLPGSYFGKHKTLHKCLFNESLVSHLNRPITQNTTERDDGHIGHTPLKGRTYCEQHVIWYFQHYDWGGGPTDSEKYKLTKYAIFARIFTICRTLSFLMYLTGEGPDLKVKFILNILWSSYRLPWLRHA